MQIPVYNGRAFLGASLPCLLHQTHTSWEAIVVDDGSSDGSLDEARRLAGDDPRFRFLRNEENRGLAATRNRALEESRGDLIAFLDADDLWSPGFLAGHARAQAASGLKQVTFSNFFYMETGRPLQARWVRRSDMPSGDLLADLIRRNRLAQSSVVVPRGLLASMDGFDASLRGSMDWDLWLRLGERGIRYLPVDGPMACYRLWPGNMTARRSARALAQVEVMERALAREQTVAHRNLYARARRRAQGDLEICRARETHGEDRPALRKALMRAWRMSPDRWRLPLSALALAWPGILGGSLAAAAALRRIRRKW